jgi:hypothetical protein
MKRRGIIVLAIALMATSAAAQPLTGGERQTLRSSVLNEERSIFVHTPRRYSESQARYPVLYLTDGGSQLAHTAATIDFLASNGRMPEMIIVGIGNTDRTRDLTPTKATLKAPDGRTLTFPTAGGADRFLSFISSELIPYVDGRYRTVPFRVFAGHSFGGLFALHVFATKPETFDAYVAVSPTLNWDHQLPLKRIRELLQQRRELKKTLVVTIADESSLTAPFRDLQRTLSGLRRKPAAFEYATRRFDDEDHRSVVLPSHYFALQKVFDGWRLPRDVTTGHFRGTYADVVDYYAKLSDRFGFRVLPPEDTINDLGYAALEQKKIQEAVQYFELNVRNYPDSGNVYDSLGDAFERTGKLEAARDQYREAVRRGEANNDSLLDAFRENLARVLKKLAS